MQLPLSRPLFWLKTLLVLTTLIAMAERLVVYQFDYINSLLKDSVTSESFIVFFYFQYYPYYYSSCFRKLNCSCIAKKLCTYSLQASHTGKPLSHLAPVLLFESIQTVSWDLECIIDMQSFLHISKTYHPILNFNTSIRRSLLVLYFIFLT